MRAHERISRIPPNMVPPPDTQVCRGQHAWYSKTAHDVLGECNKAIIDGKEVRYTACADNKEYASKYGWEDKVYVGVIERVTMYREQGNSQVHPK